MNRITMMMEEGEIVSQKSVDSGETEKEGLDPSSAAADGRSFRRRNTVLASAGLVLFAIALVLFLCLVLPRDKDNAENRKDTNDEYLTCNLLLVSDEDPDEGPDEMAVVPVQATVGPTNTTVKFEDRRSVLLPLSLDTTFFLQAERDTTSGTLAYASADPDDNQKTVVNLLRFTDGAWREASQTVSIPDYPQSIHVYDQAVYLGIHRSIGWIDFSVSTPVYRELLQRSESSILTRRNDYLLAVDSLEATHDMTLPFFADLFRLEGLNHAPVYTNEWDLGYETGHYRDAEMVSTEQGIYLVLLHSYGGMYGTGQEIKRCSVHVVSNDSETLDGNRHRSFHNYTRLGEFVGRNTGRLESPWTELVVTQGTHIAVAAGQRGILIAPVEYEKNSEQTYYSLDGDVRNIKSCGTHMWAFVEKAPRQYTLVQLNNAWEKVLSVDVPVSRKFRLG